MRLDVCVKEMASFGAFSASIKQGQNTPLTTMAEMEVSPQDDVVNPQDIKVFAVERHGRPRDFVYSRSLCGMQSWPLVFAPNHKFGYGPLQVQAPEDTFCFASVLS